MAYERQLSGEEPTTRLENTPSHLFDTPNTLPSSLPTFAQLYKSGRANQRNGQNFALNRTSARPKNSGMAAKRGKRSKASAGPEPLGGSTSDGSASDGSASDGGSALPMRYAYPSCPFVLPWEACAAWNESRLTASRAAARAQRLGAVETADLVQQVYGALLPKLHGRKLVFMGDSLHRQLFVSFACLLRAACPACFTKWNAYWFPATYRLGPHQGKKCHGEPHCDFTSAAITFKVPLEGGARGTLELHTCEVNEWLHTSSAAGLADYSPSMSKCLKRFRSLHSKDVLIYGSGLHATQSAVRVR